MRLQLLICVGVHVGEFTDHGCLFMFESVTVHISLEFLDTDNVHLNASSIRRFVKFGRMPKSFADKVIKLRSCFAYDAPYNTSKVDETLVGNDDAPCIIFTVLYFPSFNTENSFVSQD